MAEVKQPRIGITDLLILTASVCIFFVVIEQGGPAWDWEVFLKSQFAILNGILFSGLGICLVQWIRTKRAFDHPGHILWLFCGLVSFSFLIIRIFNLTPHIVTGLQRQAANVYFVMVIFASAVATLVLLMRFSKEPWWWRVTYLSLVTMFVVKCTFYLQQLFEYYFWTKELSASMPLLTHVAATCLVISVVCDFRVGIKRDWVHFAGVVVYLLYHEISVLVMKTLLMYVSVRELYGL